MTFVLLLFVSLPLVALASPRGDAASARAALLARFDGSAARRRRARSTSCWPTTSSTAAFAAPAPPRRQYLGEVQSGALKYRSIEPSVDRVQLFADSAVVTGQVSRRLHRRRARASNVNRSLFVGVLAWRDGSLADDHLDLDTVSNPQPK